MDEVHDNPTDWVAKHIREYVESGGAKGRRFYGKDALLLTTRGRRTGKLRRTALYYGEDAGRYVLVGSHATQGLRAVRQTTRKRVTSRSSSSAVRARSCADAAIS